MSDIIQNYALSVVRGVVAAHLDQPVGRISPADTLGRDLGLDLLDLAMIAMRIEDELEIELRLTALVESLTLQELSDIVADLIHDNLGEARRIA